MNPRLYHIALTVALVMALHFGAVWSGFYDWQFGTRVIWFDNVLHAIVGIGFGMGALWLIARAGRPVPFPAAAAMTLAFVFAMALAWELAEYVFFTRFTEYAYWSRIYSPSLPEALSDVASDMAGIAVFLAIARIKRRAVSSITGSSR